MNTIEKGTAYTIVFLMVDEVDDETAETGLSPTCTISKAGGAFASTTNSASEIGSGFYKVTLTTTETDTDGEMAFIATATGANVYREKYQVGTGTSLSATMAEAYATDGAEMTAIQALYMLWSFIAESSISGTTRTSKKLDGSTTAMTFTQNDANKPTSLTRSG